MNACLKLIFARNGSLEDELEQQFVKEFQRFKFTIEKDGDRQKVSEDYQDPVFETTFLVRTDKFGVELFEAMKKFLAFTEIRHPHDRPIILCQSPLLFEQKLICTLPSEPTEKVMFGNIHDNEFYNHWEVSFDGALLRVPRTLESKAHLLNQLKTFFEFDKSQPIGVEYYTVGWDKTKKINFLDQTKISVRGESIGRIIVDFAFQSTELSAPKTRLYFVLNSPAFIYQSSHDQYLKKLDGSGSRGLRLFWGAGKRDTSNKQVLTENPILCIEFENELELPLLYTIISRLHLRWNMEIPIEFGKISNFTGPKKEIDLDRFYENEFFCKFLINVFRNDANEERQFAYVYLIHALVSRGGAVTNQLSRRQSWVKFLNIIIAHYNDDANHFLCEAALEDLLLHIDSTPLRLGNLLDIFERLCEERKQSRVNNQISEQDVELGYRSVRKIALTPTRMILMSPETMMGNRILSAFDPDGTRIIRVVFRDDNWQPMRSNALHKHLKQTVSKWLEEGFTIMGRAFGFLGCSNSQMRDGGAYFMERYTAQQRKDYVGAHGNEPPFAFKPKIIECWDSMGRFDKLESIPKAMARFGQCLTQARPCKGVTIRRSDYRTIADVTGGDKNYIFTDGIGKISVELGGEIAKSLGIPGLPSAFQFRFQGYKGMLALDPVRDRLNLQYRRKHEIGEITKEQLAEKIAHCFFRDSQLKFKMPLGNKSEGSIEIVKYSTPSPLTLNRPLINILDQVSASQSPECHKRMVERIEELLDVQIEGFQNCLYNEKDFRAKLAEMTRRIYFASMDNIDVFHDPFLRANIKAYVDVSIDRLATKTQIQVPTNLGRTMFGVSDETGLLEYGQVFVKYTNNIDIKHPSKYTESTILKGKIMVTKFPATVGGDVRMLEAVDIPQLHHMQDVIVFPQKGPRPHPDEMAGSDLDGDEYAVIWDEKLFLERSETAFDYSSEKPKAPFKKEDMDQKIREFYAEHIEKEMVGQIANSHLHQSDQFGLDSQVSQSLAKKSSISLDFSKSGVAPTQLTNRWIQHKDPPERPERQPDYWVCQTRYSSLPIYTSSRLLGSLSRELKVIKDVVEESVDNPIEVRPTMFSSENDDGWKDFAGHAESVMKKYNSKIRFLMDTFGIRTEAELFSGHFRSLQPRISDIDDRSSYNTDAIIERKMTQLYREFREDFFEEFRVPGTNPNQKAFMRLTVPVNEEASDEQDDVLRRVCKSPTLKMMAKARAYYEVCYGSNSHEKRLSFAWIAYDILNFRSDKFSEEPKKIDFVPDDHANDQYRDIMDRLKILNDIYRDYKPLFCTIHTWAKYVGLLKRDKLPADWLPLVQMTYWISMRYSKTSILDFFRHLSSRQFLKVYCVQIQKHYKVTATLNFVEYHKAARVTFFKLLLNMSIEGFVTRNEGLIKEGYPFVVDLPKGVNIGTVVRGLREKSRCIEIDARLDRSFPKFDRILVSSRGTIAANHTLRDLVSVELPSIWPENRDMTKEFAALCYEKITG